MMIISTISDGSQILGIYPMKKYNLLLDYGYLFKNVQGKLMNDLFFKLRLTNSHFFPVMEYSWSEY